MGSLVIPAHNEAATIGSCIEQLQSSILGGRYEVVVVSNGSVDDTAAVAKVALAQAPMATILTLAQASKSAALRAGDAAASCYPRVYLDADIMVDEQTIADLFASLAAAAGPAVAAPSLRVDTTSSPWLVRAYHRVWAALPYVASGVIGVGIYGVNRAGGARLGTFPDQLNDDEWVRRHFGPQETMRSAGTFTARAPRTTRALIRQRARVDIGNAELAKVLGPSRRLTSSRDLVTYARRSPAAALDTAAFVSLILGARAVAAWRRHRGSATTWATDTTTRIATISDAGGLP